MAVGFRGSLPAPRRASISRRGETGLRAAGWAGRAMAPPKCLNCSRDSTCLESAALRATWAAHEGVKWGWHTDEAAYWFLCLPCHRRAWPLDQRCENRHSRPWDAIFPWYVRSGVRSLVVGDFYLTQPPPELLRGRLGGGGPWQNLPRSRSPRRELAAAAGSATSAPAQASVPSAAAADSALESAAPATGLRGCLKGSRRGPPPPRVILGREVVTVRHFLRPGMSGPRRYREASCFEEVVDWPWMPREERGPHLPSAGGCDACGTTLGDSARNCAERVELEGSPGQAHAILTCRRCWVDGALATGSLRLQDEALGPGAVAVPAWSSGPTRVERLEYLGVRHTPKQRTSRRLVCLFLFVCVCVFVCFLFVLSVGRS